MSLVVVPAPASLPVSPLKRSEIAKFDPPALPNVCHLGLQAFQRYAGVLIAPANTLDNATGASLSSEMNLAIRCYNRMILGFLLFATSGALLINTLVDPLRVISAPWQLEFLDSARDISKETRTGKAGLAKQHPEVELGLFGSSRVAIGLRPQDPAWQGVPAINFGCPCSMLYENIAMLEFSLSRNPNLKWVVLNLDFGDLVSLTDSRSQADFFNSPLAPEPAFGNNIRYLIGESTLKYSKHVVGLWRSGRMPPFDTYGNWTGWHVANIRKRFEGEKGLLSFHLQVDGRYGNHPEQLKTDKTEALHNVLAKCLRRNIRVSLITMPLHALHYTWMGEGDVPGAPYETERRYLCSLVEQLKAEHPGNDIEWWDFTVFHPITTEVFAFTESEDEETHPRPIFWTDPVHPNAHLGSIMSARVAGTRVPAHPGSALGLRVDPSNLEEHLASQVEGDRKYRAEHPEEIRWAQEVMEKARAH